MRAYAHAIFPEICFNVQLAIILIYSVRFFKPFKNHVYVRACQCVCMCARVRVRMKDVVIISFDICISVTCVE